MKDDASILVTGILIQSEIERKNNQAKREQQYKNDELSHENSVLEEEKKSVVKKNVALKEDNEDLLDDVQNLHIINRDLREKNQGLYEKAVELQAEVNNFKYLLCKPMAEIAEKNGNFKETYEKQMELMATWMVSQKAFKQLAIEFGAEKGLTTDEVIEMGKDKEIDVLESNNDEANNTNANNSSIIRPKIEQLKEKYNRERKHKK